MAKAVQAPSGGIFRAEMIMETKPGYKQTEIGVIPLDWHLDYIENFAVITTGSKNTQDRVEDGEYPFFVRSQTIERINSYSFDGEAVLTAGDGVGTGKVFHYINGRFDVHQRVYRISNFAEHVNGYFFHLYFSTHFYNRIMQMTAKSSVDSVRRDMISRMLVALPPTEAEQRAIATALSDVDALLAALDRLIAKQRDLKQAAMQQLLTGQTRLPGFTGKWETAPLSTFVRNHNSGVYKNSDSYGHGSNILGVSDIYGIDSVDGQQFSKVPLSPAERAKHTLATNDLLYGESSLVREGIARTVYVTELGAGTAFAWHTRRYSVNQSVLHSPFLYYYLQSRPARKHMMDQAIQTAITGINTVAYFACPVLVPPLPEQTAIATVLSDMDLELAALEQRRDKTRALKQGMMQELLTGRTRLV
jgi:type I restriction enzyme S subunit